MRNLKKLITDCGDGFTSLERRFKPSVWSVNGFIHESNTPEEAVEKLLREVVLDKVFIKTLKESDIFKVK